MDNKFNNMINEFLANTDAKDEKELNEKLQEFMQKYNAGEIDYTNTILDDAYELLEKAENTKSKTQAIKYAKEAYLKTGCRGVSRIDFIVDENDNPCVIEINTIPGMTATSLVPDSARYLGIEFPQLVDKIVKLALEK